MKLAVATTAAGVMLGAAGPSAAGAAADYVVIPLETDVDAPPETAWPRIKGFCNIADWVKTTCVIASGKDGEPGAVRRLAGRVDEMLVAVTAWSYTYILPKSRIEYHATVEIRPDAGGGSKLSYTLLYDQAALPAGANKAADRDKRRTQFTRILAAMKASAEAGRPQ